ELGRGQPEDFQPARIERGYGVFTANDMKRRLFARASLRHAPRAVVEIEGGEADLARNQSARREPSETAGNHQMKHGEQIAVEAPHEALAHAMEIEHAMPVERRQGRVEGAHEERAGDPRP